MSENNPLRSEGRRAFPLPGPMKFYLAGIVVALALGYLFYNTFQSATVFYYTINELYDQGPLAYGKQVRVNGNVLTNSIDKEEEGVLVRFQLTDGESALPVTFRGVPPDLFFLPHADVVVEGRLGPDKIFVANNVITMCASKYEAET